MDCGSLLPLWVRSLLRPAQSQQNDDGTHPKSTLGGALQ